MVQRLFNTMMDAIINIRAQNTRSDMKTLIYADVLNWEGLEESEDKLNQTKLK
jgi:hypothetical protein